jgi:feruloyl-CoA synthase
MVLRGGGAIYIDGGKPAPGLIEQSIANLRDISPSIYYNVPAGFGMILPYLEADEELRDKFFEELKLIMYAGAALPADLWRRLEDLSIKSRGERVVMSAAWGSTETAPMATLAHFLMESSGNIGVPVPGVSIKMVPSGDKMELRVKGPNITPGYLKRDDLTAAAFDDEGYYCIGDAGRLADPEDGAKGIVFDGRVAEDFKLLSGTWVAVGSLRVEVLAAASPALQDAVVTGHDRDEIGLLAWPNLEACRDIAGLGEDASPGEIIAHPKVLDHILQSLAAHNAGVGGSSRRICRLILMLAPASIDANEITDKGYINQRATLENRADLIEAMYAARPGPEVLMTPAR